jgi:hypothetical protein
MPARQEPEHKRWKGELQLQSKSDRVTSHAGPEDAAHVILGHACLNFPQWQRFAEGNREFSIRCLREFMRREDGPDRKLSQLELDNHVKACAFRLLATGMTGRRAFRALIVPRGDVGPDARGKVILRGLSLEFVRWLESRDHVKVHLRTIDGQSAAFPRIGVHFELE